MKHKALSYFLLAVALGAMASRAGAESAEPSGEDRLRVALRDAVVQQRAAESQAAALQASNGALTDEKAAWQKKFETLRQQTVTERAETDKTITNLRAELANRKAAEERLQGALTATRAELAQTRAARQSAEAGEAQLTALKEAWERRAEQRAQKNVALFKVANDILNRYESFGLGTALKAKEPFIGRTRTELENLVQDYEDKLLDNRVAP